MELNEIKFTTNSDGDAIPETVGVTMTAREAVVVADILGQIPSGGDESAIYSVLVGDVFNRYWDGGTDEAMREFGIRRIEVFTREQIARMGGEE